jgi:hypothetical protein
MEQGKAASVVEIALFKTKEGVTRERFLSTVGPVSEWIQRQPGFVSRDLTYSAEDDTWIDVIWWNSLEEAHAAMEASTTSETCAPMFEAIDPERVQMLHGVRAFPTVSVVGERVGG